MIRLTLMTLLAIGSAIDLASADDAYDVPPINYASTAPRDAMAALNRRLASGKLHLQYEPAHGYLKSLLKALDIDTTTQVLVFSKTSFQIRRINPDTPRAIYFNDDVYVGWVLGGDVIEISTVDPKLGGVFYTIDQQPPEADAPPTITRRFGECMQCHTSPMTQSVPGHMVRSVITDPQGFLQLRAEATVSDGRTAFGERFGGWYVTGTHGDMRHRGNITMPRKNTDEEDLDLDAGANLTDLSSKLDVAPYLSKHSDMVALMVLEHQTHMHNLITRATYRTRIALDQEEQMNRALGRPPGSVSEHTLRRIQRAGDALLRYLLLVDEEILEDPITGVGGFTEHFQKQGPFDDQGRSLRQLNLRKYLFEYPCSYLIYSESFDAMPGPMLDYVYRRLYDILTGRDRDAPFDAISTAKRRAVLEILRQTKSSLPVYFFKD
ncbi:hypothetical protein HED60_01665 [Planctomycetales bacterium ZRK34]|nr:hypothetical protein HED60_01665 [Planctomycetales bacterium ZRK34]